LMRCLLSMMIFFALLAFVAVCGAQGPSGAYDQAWEDYKLEFDKHYSPEEEALRYANWQKDVEEVTLHNALYSEDFKQEVNQFSDLTDEEFEDIYLSGNPMAEEASNVTYHVASNDPIPNSVDWRQQGCVTKVKNQGRCGSCYSFAATGALEGAWKKAKGRLPNLSEQQIVDCSGRYHNMGCRGGRFQNAWLYLRDAGGDETEEAYPYRARQGYCRFSRSKVAATVRSYKSVRPGESNLANALAQVGPVAVSIDARPSSIRRYRSGVHYAPSCSSRRHNHAVLTVGYGTEGGKDYWLVKNSWGSRWGAGGYIKMARNRGNNCGIANWAAYPVV